MQGGRPPPLFNNQPSDLGHLNAARCSRPSEDRLSAPSLTRLCSQATRKPRESESGETGADLLNGAPPFSDTGPQIDFALSQMRARSCVNGPRLPAQAEPRPDAPQV